MENFIKVNTYHHKTLEMLEQQQDEVIMRFATEQLSENQLVDLVVAFKVLQSEVEKIKSRIRVVNTMLDLYLNLKEE